MRLLALTCFVIYATTAMFFSATAGEQQKTLQRPFESSLFSQPTYFSPRQKTSLVHLFENTYTPTQEEDSALPEEERRTQELELFKSVFSSSTFFLATSFEDYYLNLSLIFKSARFIRQEDQKMHLKKKFFSFEQLTEDESSPEEAEDRRGLTTDAQTQQKKVLWDISEIFQQEKPLPFSAVQTPRIPSRTRKQE